MRILHYSLGFPPQRRGGLVNYCLDLASEQVRGGNQVALLYPGKASLWSKEPRIKAKTRQTSAGVTAYEIINPLPLSIMGGFRNPASFMKPVADPGVYEEFLAEVKPSVIHLHTLYGLHQEFLVAAHRQGIPLVYTTHDYYGLCANPTFFYQNEDYSQKNSVDLWYAISAAGMGDGKVAQVLAALVAKDFKGFASLEPHLSIFDGFAALEKEGVSIATEKSDGEKLFTVASDALKKIIVEDLGQEWK